MIPYSTEIHWRVQSYSYTSGLFARTTYWYLLECELESKFVRFLEWVHKVHLTERKISQVTCVRGETNKESSNYKTWKFVAWSVDQNWKKPLKTEKSKSGQSRSQNLIMLEDWEAFILLIRKMVNIRKPSKMRGESWKFHLMRLCHVKNEDSWRQSMHVSWTRRGSWRKTKARTTIFWKHKETKRKSTLPQWWTHVISKKCGVRNEFAE